MLGALLRKWRGIDQGPDMEPLYQAIVRAARSPHWYLHGGVEDSVNGRFEMVAAVLAIVLVRLESEGEAGHLPSARLTEVFVNDMDGQLRQEGVGDVVVGKHIGKMMSALGGRISAYREGLATGDLTGAIRRNLHRDSAQPTPAITHAADGLFALQAALADQSLSALMAGGEWPQ